jgi:hypothetical protein
MCNTNGTGASATAPLPSPLPSVQAPEARVAALNVANRPDKDGVVRGSILPIGQRQDPLRRFVAVVTLILFVAWPWVFVSLLIASVCQFSSHASVSAVALPSTCCVLLARTCGA